MGGPETEERQADLNDVFRACSLFKGSAGSVLGISRYFPKCPPSSVIQLPNISSSDREETKGRREGSDVVRVWCSSNSLSSLIV